MRHNIKFTINTYSGECLALTIQGTPIESGLINFDCEAIVEQLNKIEDPTRGPVTVEEVCRWSVPRYSVEYEGDLGGVITCDDVVLNDDLTPNLDFLTSLGVTNITEV